MYQIAWATLLKAHVHTTWKRNFYISHKSWHNYTSTSPFPWAIIRYKLPLVWGKGLTYCKYLYCDCAFTIANPGTPGSNQNAKVSLVFTLTFLSLGTDAPVWEKPRWDTGPSLPLSSSLSAAVTECRYFPPSPPSEMSMWIVHLPAEQKHDMKPQMCCWKAGRHF